MTAIRSPKYKEILKECNGSKTKAIVRTYWPSFVAGSIAVTGIVLAERINLKEIAAITGVCTYLGTKLKKTEEAVKKYGGEDLLQKVREEANKETVIQKVNYVCHGGPSIEETGRGDLLCLENFSGRLFRSSEVNVCDAVDEAQKLISECNDFIYNYLYELLGISWSDFGHRFGFPGDEGYADAKIFDTTYYETGKFCMGPDQYNAEPILVIDVLETPDLMFIDGGVM